MSPPPTAIRRRASSRSAIGSRFVRRPGDRHGRRRRRPALGPHGRRSDRRGRRQDRRLRRPDARVRDRAARGAVRLGGAAIGRRRRERGLDPARRRGQRKRRAHRRRGRVAAGRDGRRAASTSSATSPAAASASCCSLRTGDCARRRRDRVRGVDGRAQRGSPSRSAASPRPSRSCSSPSAATPPGFDSPVPVVVDVVHLGAASVWLAGVVGLFWLVEFGGLDADELRASRAAVLGRRARVGRARRSAPATYQAWIETYDFTSIGTPYSLTLAAKVGAVRGGARVRGRSTTSTAAVIGAGSAASGRGSSSRRASRWRWSGSPRT